MGQNDNRLYAQNPTPEMRLRGVQSSSPGRKWYEPFQPDPNSPSERFGTQALGALKGLLSRGSSAPTSGAFGGVSEMGDIAPTVDSAPAYAGPRIMPMPPAMFRNAAQEPAVPSPTPMSRMATVEGSGIEGPRMEMFRTPGGQGMGGREWALANQGPSDAVKALNEQYRVPTEELFKQANRQSGVAPGANQWAASMLEDRLGAEDFARLLGQQKQETVEMAEAELSPQVQQSPPLE